MNANVKDSLRLLASKCNNIVFGFLDAISSVLRMFLFTKLHVAIKSKQYYKYKKHKSCTILGNGPSLKSAMVNGDISIDDVDIFCVNSFCESDFFWKIKPTNYFLIDGQFFNPTIERCIKQVDTLVAALNKVDWDINLFIPSHAINGGVLGGLDNDKIHII